MFKIVYESFSKSRACVYIYCKSLVIALMTVVTIEVLVSVFFGRGSGVVKTFL